MNTPLYTALTQYANKMDSFHMPGHKLGKNDILDELELLKIDNTEATGLDNLYEAQGIIEEAMELMAAFYKSKRTFFLTNGSTAGILASILAVVKEGEKIIVARNCHHSVWSGLILSGARAVYIHPQYRMEDMIQGEVQEEAIKRALEEHPDAVAVIIVSPTYEGIVSNIEEIAKTVHAAGKVLIVDEAHGAHFCLKNFPVSSIEQGADIVINSMHKTLPSLTQSGLLHIASDRVDEEGVLNALRMVQTSSPSYMMMGTMDYIRGYITENIDKIHESYIEPLMSLREELKGLSKLTLFEPDTKNYDRGKLVITVKNTSISGYELADRLYKKYNLSVEAALESHIILITSFADRKETFDRLKRALFEIDKDISFLTCQGDIGFYFKNESTEAEIPRKVYYAQKEWVPLELAEGKIVAKTIMLYPPGIPLWAIGEKLDAQAIKEIKSLQDRLQGIKKEINQIKVYVANID